MIEPMLCHEVKVDESIWKEHGMDGAAVTAAYRKSIVEELKKLIIRGFVAERKVILREVPSYSVWNWTMLQVFLMVKDLESSLSPFVTKREENA